MNREKGTMGRNCTLFRFEISKAGGLIPHGIDIVSLAGWSSLKSS